MRDVYQTGQFEKDLAQVLKAMAAKGDTAKFKAELALVAGRLMMDVALEVRHVDHKLNGNWVGFRDCHVFNDLVLIYRKYDKNSPHKVYGDNALVLTRLGTHSALSL